MRSLCLSVHSQRCRPFDECTTCGQRLILTQSTLILRLMALYQFIGGRDKRKIRGILTTAPRVSVLVGFLGRELHGMRPSEARLRESEGGFGYPTARNGEEASTRTRSVQSS